MSTYLKNMAGYKHNQLKSKSYDEIQEMFDKEMKRVNTFVDMDTELVKGSKTKAEGSSKRAGEELESDNSKKQRIDEHVEAKGDDDQEEAEMKKHMEIVQDDEVVIDAIPLATKPPVIVEWKIIKEGKMGYFQLIRADGSSKRKKHFAALRAQEKKNKPPTKAQKRNIMSTYLKNMAGYKHNQLKSKSYDEIQEMFDKEMKRVNTFVDMDTELMKGSKTKAERSSKRAGEELKSDNSKKQRIDKHVEA
ncbi:hypothetical protein Tco_1463795, partial [Tanacetum coccineum]